jgi:hypothetical protein
MARLSPAAFLVLVILCLKPGHAQTPFFECGVLETHSSGNEECILLRAGHLYWLSTLGGFSSGDTVLVQGVAADLPAPPCTMANGVIDVESIQACYGFDFGCGVVSYDDGCWYFDSPAYLFLLHPRFGMQSGDTVQVYGSVWGVLTWCRSSVLIEPDSVRACSQLLPAVHPTTWGALKVRFR